MNIVYKAKLAITRLVGPDNWNVVLQSFGWSKFHKKNKNLAEHIEENQKYKNKYAGKRAFIIGNGPSLREQELSVLKDEYVFTCNQIMRNDVYPSLRSNFHFFADPSFFCLKKDNAGDMEVLEQMRKINTPDNRPVCFFSAEGFDFSKEFRLNDVLDMHYFEHRLELTESFNQEINFSRFVPNLYTVVHYAIAMAIYMGFSEIYLLGCDCTNVITAVNTRLQDGNGAEYAYAITENEKARMKQRNARIHMEDELRSFSEVFRSYRILFQYCEGKGIKMINCTRGGLLDSVPRKALEEVLNEKV